MHGTKGMDNTQESSGNLNIGECGSENDCQYDYNVALRKAIHSRLSESVKVSGVKYLVEQCGADVNGKDISGWTMLHAAVNDGTQEIVEYLVEKGADVNGKDTRGWTVLHHAVNEGTQEIVKYLVENGANINGKDTKGWTGLHHAVTEGWIDQKKYLVEMSVYTYSGNTVQHAAVTYDCLQKLQYLVENGADVNGKTDTGWTVLQAAVATGGLEKVQYLVEKGADVNGKNAGGWTVLHSAVTSGSLEIVKYLVQNGANVNEKKTSGWRVVNYLVGLGAYVTGKTTFGWTVLHAAVAHGSLEMVKYLVKKGADVNGKDTKGWTVLHNAIYNNPFEMIKYIVEKGADVNGKNTKGWSVLHSAVTTSIPEIVRYLVEQDADLNGRDINGVTPLEAAVKDSVLDMVKCLVELGAKDAAEWRVLHRAVCVRKLDIVRYLVEHGAEVNGKDADGWTVLHVAVERGSLEIIKYLVEHGAELQLKSKRDVHSLGIDILKLAVVSNSVGLVNLLLEKNIAVWKAGIVLVEGRKISLLEWSIHLGHNEIATILKKSVKHREKIQMLKTTDFNNSGKIGIPMQAFVAKNQFKIGGGGFSCVYVGLMPDGSEVAVKRILVQSEDETIENEREIMSLTKTDSPFIVSYRYFHRGDDFMYLIVDLCEETLREFVQTCSIEYLEEHGPRIIKEILSGLVFLHGKGILHRDLKPSNVLVDVESRMKLADFGISRVLNDNETTFETSAKGTHGWMPPEVIKAIEENEKGPFKRKSDVHVAGMIAFFTLTKGEHPFGSSLDRMRNISEGNCVNIEKLDDREARKCVSWLINHKIDDRPYASEALRDPFINKD